MDKFPKKEIENLLRKIIDDDPLAFDRLFDLKKDNLLRLAYTYLHDEMLAEDVVSEVFYELIKVKTFKNKSNLNGWLNVTAINKSLNILKKMKNETFIEDYKVPERSYERDDLERIHIRDCLLNLDESERQVIIYQQNGYTIREMTKIMGLTTKQLRGLLDRAKGKFKEFYNK